MESANEANTETKVGRKYVKVTKRKLTSETTLDELLKDWSQCCHYLKNKQRLCNIQRTPGSKYCGNHPHPEEEGGIPELKNYLRIPCPLDSAHTVFAKHLEAHLKICNQTKIENEISSQPFYCLNCNSGSNGQTNTSTNVSKNDIVSTSKTSCSDVIIDPDELMLKVNNCFEFILQLNEIHTPELMEDEALDHTLRLALGGKEQTAFRRVKHIEQDIQMVHQMVDHGLLKDRHIEDDGTSYMDGAKTGVPVNATDSENISTSTEQRTAGASDTVYVELGAGKGLLGLAVNCADPEATLVLVERGVNRNKVDRYLKAHNRSFHRLHMDIRHCNLRKVPGVDTPVVTDEIVDSTVHTLKSAGTNVVVIAKHLCGCASDMAIRSLHAISTASEGSEGVRSSEGFRRGVAIATCCHHACNYADYTGIAFYHSQGFTRPEFDVLRIWSGWAPLLLSISDRNIEEGEQASTPTAAGDSTPQTSEHSTEEVREQGKVVIRPRGITYSGMAQIGQRVKRILDVGRIHYLRDELNLDARLVKYCSDALSPECMMIICKEKEKKEV